MIRVVAADAVRLAGNNKIWNVIVSDGQDYVRVAFWSGAVDRFMREFGENYLVSLKFRMIIKRYGNLE